MTQYTWPDDDETTEVTYTSLLPGKRRQIPVAPATCGSDKLEGPEEAQASDRAAHPDTITAAGRNAASLLAAPTTAPKSREGWPRGDVDDPRHWWQIGEHRPVGSVRDVWPLAYRRMFRVIFCCALLVLGMLLGALTPGQAVALFHISAAPSARPAMSTPPTVASERGTGWDAPAPLMPDARFAIAVLSVHCLLNSCDEVQDVAAGQHIYPRQEGVPCTTVSAVAVVGRGERFVYCRLDQPNVFAYSFDGARFDCVGSLLGCHNVVIVDTTNGR
jgi:hypothetical protein